MTPCEQANGVNHPETSLRQKHATHKASSWAKRDIIDGHMQCRLHQALELRPIWVALDTSCRLQQKAWLRINVMVPTVHNNCAE